MAAHGRRTDHPVAQSLFAEAYRFDFYQAVRLLELLRPAGMPVGEGADPTREAVRFHSHVGLEFPASDVAEVTQPAGDGQPAAMTVNFLGLAGALGPLPRPFTELILERVWRKDTALKDFLDIFNHRLVSLLYRVRKLHRLGLDLKSPERTPVARYLYALMGLGTKGLQGRMQVRDRALLFYGGLIAQQPHAMVGLECLLSDYFQVQVKGRQCRGAWYALEDDQVTRIGVSGQNQRLSQGAVVGTRVWDQQGQFELELGPLTLGQFLDFLPIGRGFQPLCELTRFYVGEAFDFDLRLTLQAAEVPESRLSVTSGPRLAWTSWLKTRAFTEDDSQVRLAPRSESVMWKGVRIPLFADLPLDALAEIVSQMTVHRFPRGAVVVRRGDPGTSLFVISCGAVDVMGGEGDGQRRVGSLKEGDFFGEISLLTGSPITATIVTVQDAEILELSRHTLEGVIAKFPCVERQLKLYLERRAQG